MYFWLSFADGSLPEGTQFLGACVIPAESFELTVLFAHMTGINPGGEVLGYEIPEDRNFLVEPSDIGRLMTRAECEAFDRRVLAKLGS